MSSDNPSNPQAERLIGKFLDESISPAEFEQLEAMLQSDPELRQSFYEQSALHSDLSPSKELIEPESVVPFKTNTYSEPQKWKSALWFAGGSIAAALVFWLMPTTENQSESVSVPPASTLEPTAPSPQKRYKEIMATLPTVGSQSRAPGKSVPAVTDGTELSYNRDIRPILSDRCFTCHGPDEGSRKAGLRLDTPEGAYAALDDEYHQIKPGDPEKSEVYYRITTDDPDEMMPPAKAKLPRLTSAEVAKIKTWIELGAPYESHWSFTKIERPEVPEAAWPEQARNPIDHFIQRKLKDNDLTPAPAADPLTLLRRINFDLTGLPPAQEAVNALIQYYQVDDSIVSSPGLNTIESDKILSDTTVQLLKSIHHAEHLTSTWLDRARYADTTGYQYDTPRIMWRWRDWVIDSYHENKPYDQFLIEQIAGDLLPDPTLEQKVATGYNRNHPITIEGGTIDEEYRVQYVSDRTNTIGSSLLGLTMECAKCHDHKYDPISQADYFRMYAFFNSIPERGRASGGTVGSEKGAIAAPFIMAPTDEQAAREVELSSKLNTALDSIFTSEGKYHAGFEKWRADYRRDVGWNVLDVKSATASSGATLRDLGDKSWLAEGALPVKPEVYTFQLSVNGRDWRSIKLDALLHESMSKGGPGRSGNGNAVLSKVEARVKQGDLVKEITFDQISASFAQADYPASNILKDPGGKGWGVYHPKQEDRHLILGAKEPFGVEGDWTLEVVLSHSKQWRNHSFGRMRLSASRLDEVTASSPELSKWLQIPNQKLNVAQKQGLAMAYLAKVDAKAADQLKAISRELEQLRKQIPPVMVMEEMKVPRPTHVLGRGEYNNPVGDPLTPGAPAVLNSFSEDLPRNRLGFVRWMTHRDNPLTARVAVNQLWDAFFGVGIVKTLEDFGSQGEWPSHPQLLDWLAVEFIDSGWDLQHIIRLITESATYRQSSYTRAAADEKDPENRLVHRGPRSRLSAEAIRDQALAVSGLLNPKVGGPGVNPYQPPGIWEELTLRKNYAMSYEESAGNDIYRRSVYTFWKRAAPPAMMAVFDAPSREICTVRRESTNTPLQALAVLNGDTFIEAARALAQELLANYAEATDEQLIEKAFLQIVHRPPGKEEMQILLNTFMTERSRSDDPNSMKLLEVGRLPLDTDLPKDRLLGLTMVNRLLLNLSETVSRH